LFKTNETRNAVVSRNIYNVHNSELQPKRSHCNNTAWQQSHWYLVNRRDAEVSVQLANTMPTTKFTQETRNGNRLRREITSIKHARVCLPEILNKKPPGHQSFEMDWRWQHNNTQP